MTMLFMTTTWRFNAMNIDMIKIMTSSHISSYFALSSHCKVRAKRQTNFSSTETAICLTKDSVAFQYYIHTKITSSAAHQMLH